MSTNPNPDNPPARANPELEAPVQQELADRQAVPPEVPPSSIETGPEQSAHPQLLSPKGRGDDEEDIAPTHFGCYRIVSLLGSGGFGSVYKGFDEDLQRDVAIKVPRRQRLATPEDAEAYQAEARILASLEHPHIVPVHAFGRTPDGLCFIVSKFIAGSDLARRIKEAPPALAESANLVAIVAEALHHAHGRRLVHRDIKPGNILIDETGKPYVADFGLALKEEDVGKGGGLCGTPAYMSPEQANGEGHRVDGRSDIFSLGVVFYELLTGRRPFRGDTTADLLAQIVSQEVRPPRQVDDTIPKELERICLKALAKRASERYTTAKDLAEDLRHWQAGERGASALSGEREVSTPLSSQASASSPPQQPLDTGRSALQPVDTSRSPDSQRLKIVPKGLRSFDAQDADFFLELLPGPRDRDGLPDSIRFWKQRIEEMDPETTFAVGLIYGPSGCGKSSLVKAGLLPRLAERVLAVYVEATAEETESRLLNRLRKRCADLPAHLGLQETLAALRRGQGLPAGQKVLLVLDQFEQWLHAKREEQHTELVQALRQCDGGRVQAVVLVRDDFWMAATRFMRALDIRLLEGQNSAAVDLFPPHHAEKVLAAFGRAFGVLPENPAAASPEQQQFLEQAVGGLAQEGKVICVRLALFAEMMKGKAWTPATLRAVGGTEGVGVTFLEETFSAATAPPEHRYHQKAARAVLTALLPESGTDIKGHMRSAADLLTKSGYAGRPGEFADLIGILDRELRLVTPTDPEGAEEATEERRTALLSRPAQPDGSGEPAYPPRSPDKFYQLTHDYLVPSLRTWLTRKQRETRRGRADLRLAERAAAWNAKPENRHLPAWWEWLSIRWLTRRQHWTSPQRQMMRTATRFHALRGAALAVLLAVATLIGLGITHRVIEHNQAIHAAGLVHGLVNAEIAQAPGIVADLEDYRAWADPLIQQEHQKAAANSPAQLHTSMALLRCDPGQLDFLGGRLLAADADKFPVLRDFLKPHLDSLLPRLWSVVEDKNQPAESRFKAACALATYAPEDGRWQKINEEVATALASQNALVAKQWVAALRPVSGRLLAPLAVIFRDRDRRETERSLATDILADYAAEQPVFLADLLLDGDDKQFAVLFPRLQAHAERGPALLQAEVDRHLSPTWQDAPLDPAWKPPAEALVQKIEAAQGLLVERFALCQTMPLKEFLQVAEELRLSGYRPIRFRPYPALAPLSPRPPKEDNAGNLEGGGRGAGGEGGERRAERILVAAVWTRDGLPWQLAHGLSAEAMGKRNAEQVKKSFQPIDVACYLQSGAATYAALWVQNPPGAPATHLEVGLEDTQPSEEALAKDGFLRIQQAVLMGPDRKERWSIIWRKNTAPTAPEVHWFVGLEPDYAGDNYMASLQLDVQVSKAGPMRSTRERYTERLAEAEKEIKTKPEDANARWPRAVACVYLDENAKALADLTFFLGKFPQNAEAFRWRAIVQARLGKTQEARADVAKFQEFDGRPRRQAYLEAVVSAYLGEDVEGLKRLDAAVAAHARQKDFLYSAASAYAVAAQAVAGKEAARAKSYAEQAMALLQDAVKAGFADYTELQTNADFDPLRQLPAFQALLQPAHLERHYAVIWQASLGLTSTEFHGLAPLEHRARCRTLLAQGYQPVSLSVAEIQTSPRPGQGERGRGEGLVAASVWQRSVVPEDQKEALAKRQANAAAALLKLGKSELVWPLLKHSADNRLRSYLLHRLKPFAIEPGLLWRRFQEEKELSIQRALLLGLGEFEPDQLAAGDREAVRDKVLSLYRDAPDAGLHGSARWLLRQWGQEAKLKKIDEELATGKPEGGRSWYVTGQQQTYVVIPGPVEFRMGSPATEAKRSSHERLHRRRIGRWYAIAATHVTVEQFKKFWPKFGHDEMHRCPEPDCPILGVTWHEAAAYCNWLSEQEGIPKEQWCYLPNQEGKLEEGMQLAPDYLARTGYRLPTEAEWENACRVGALTRRYFGETDELLGGYAWYDKNARLRTWPVGSLRPNDLGLFDVHGSLWTWCQERYQNYPESIGLKRVEDNEDIKYINERQSRPLRGGAFPSYAGDVRSAFRNRLAPATRGDVVGFRPARTVTP